MSGMWLVRWDERPDPHDVGPRLVGPFPSKAAAHDYATAYAGARGGSWSWNAVRVRQP